MAGDVLILGEMVFDTAINTFAVPNKIDGGSGQLLAVAKTIGGARTIDAMGPDPDPIKWTGRWRAPDAVANNDIMIAMAEAGDEIACTWGAYFYNVVISRYTYEYEASFEITYSIELTVLPDVGGFGGLSLDGLIGMDLSTALGVASFQ